MKYNLFIYNAENGSTYDYAPVVQEVTYTTNKDGSPGKLDFEYVQEGPLNLTEGAKVLFYADGLGIFSGFVFTIEQDKMGVVSVTAYDQIRYLKTNASYSFVGKKLGDIIKRIATDMQLNVGQLEDTGYVIPTLTKEDTECLDIIDYGMMLTQNNTGKVFVFFDDFGKLSLRESGRMIAADIIGSKSLLSDYKYKSDIDSDTYNQIKLVRPNQETGQGDTYVFRDGSNIKKWGLLQKYTKVDENLNAAQISEQGNIMMACSNRVLKSISVDAMGVLGLRAGGMAMFQVGELPELAKGYLLLIDKAKHKFSNGEHTMSLDARILTI